MSTPKFVQRERSKITWDWLYWCWDLTPKFSQVLSPRAQGKPAEGTCVLSPLWVHPPSLQSGVCKIRGGSKPQAQGWAGRLATGGHRGRNYFYPPAPPSLSSWSWGLLSWEIIFNTCTFCAGRKESCVWHRHRPQQENQPVQTCTSLGAHERCHKAWPVHTLLFELPSSPSNFGSRPCLDCLI